ncbi:MAG: hypothetical protein FWB85_08780 [Chitinispirillia bacterium]|nr:hypothetical protein [Chitinispirillia bacterium]
MLKIQRVGEIPAYLNVKIESVRQMCERENFNPFRGGKWKKLSGLKSAFSYGLTANYRVLLIIGELFFVGCHDEYEKKIRIMKRAGGCV